MSDEELVERVALTLQDVADISSLEAEHVARAIIPIVQAEQRERDAAIAEADAEQDWTDGVSRGGIIADAIRKGAE